MLERWEPLGGRYAVSDQGRVRGPRGILTAYQTRGHYFINIIEEDGQRRTRSLGKLVAEHFVRLPESNCSIVRHKNGDGSDNRAANLEWVVRDKNHKRKQPAGVK